MPHWNSLKQATRERNAVTFHYSIIPNRPPIIHLDNIKWKNRVQGLPKFLFKGTNWSLFASSGGVNQIGFINKLCHDNYILYYYHGIIIIIIVSYGYCYCIIYVWRNGHLWPLEWATPYKMDMFGLKRPKKKVGLSND